MAIPTCALTSNQIEALYKAVLGKIITDKNKGIIHDPETFMKDLYTLLKNAPGGSEATAIDYIQHVPRMLNTAQATLEDISDYMMDSGVSLDKMNKLRRDFKDIEKVKDFLKADSNPVVETIKEIVEETHPVNGVIDTKEYDDIENKDKQLKSVISSENQFDALPETALAQVNQEAQDYGGIEAKQNVPDPDPKKQTYYKVVRSINNMLAKSGLTRADNLTLGSVTGIFLKAVKASDVAIEDLYTSQQEYLNNDDPASKRNGKTSKQKITDRESGDDILLVYSDKNGNIIYFDKNGIPSSKEAGGTIAYSTIRRVYKNNAGERSVARVQSVEDLSNKPGAPTKDQLQKARNTEMDILEKMRQHVINNPTDTLLFSVTPGKNGYVKEDFTVRHKISDIDLENGFTPYYSSIEGNMKVAGGVYFNVPGYENPILIQRPKFSEIPNLVEALATMLFDSNIPDYKKIQVLRQFTQSKETSLFEKDNKLFVKQGEDVFDLSDPTNKEKFVNNISTQTVNINKDLLNSTFENPVKVGDKVEFQTKNYSNFISENFYTNLQTNAEGKIQQLNAYNIIQPTAEATSKMFPVLVQAAPVSTETKTDIERRKNQKLQELYNSEIEKEDRDALNKIYNTGKIGDTISVGVYTFTKTGEDEWTSSDDAGSFSYSTEKMGNIYFDIEKGKSKEATALAFLAAKLNTNNVEIPQKEIENLPLIKQILNIEKEAKAELAALEGKPTEVKPTVDLSREWKGDLESRPVYTPEGINVMRTSSAKPNENFGNPWSEGGYAGTIKTSSVSEAAQNYKDWLLGTKFQDVKPEQRKWILDQINQGKLDGATLLYSGKLMGRGQGSHANSLADVVEKLRYKEEKEGRFKDKEKRIRIEYPVIITESGNEMKSADLVKMSEVSEETPIEIPEDVKDDNEYIEKLYGENVAYAYETFLEQISKEQAEFLRDNPEFAEAFVQAYSEDEDQWGLDEYADKLLSENERLIDTAQLEFNFGLDQATPTDSPLDILRAKLKESGKMLKEQGLSSEATDAQIATAEEWYKGHPLAQIIPFQALFNIVNSNAKAEFTLAGITLFAGSNFTDLYHEGWHVFSQMFLTLDQKKALYNEARKLTGTFTTVKGEKVSFKNATDLQLEEFMAEDFRKYVLSDGKKIIDGRSTRNNIFQKIYNFLKQLFKGVSYNDIVANKEAIGTIKDLYDKLWMGDINDYSPSLNNVQFSLLNKGIQSLNAAADQNTGLNYQDSMTLSETIDSEMAKVLTDLEMSVGSVFTDPSAMEAIYNVVKYNLAELKKNLDPNSNGARILEFGLKEWGDFRKVANGEQTTGVLAFHKMKSEYITFDEKYAEMSPLEKDIDEETKEPSTMSEEGAIQKTENELRDQFGSNAFERKGNESSVRSIASNETVYLVKSLPQVGKNSTNSLGASKLVDFNKTWGIIINTIAGSINKTEMYNRLNKASETYPELKQLVKRLGEPMAKTNNVTDATYYHMWTKFFRDFSVYKIPIKEVQVIKNVGEDQVVGGFEVRFVESDPVVIQVQRNFVTTFETAKGGDYITKINGTNTLNVSKIISDFPKSSLSNINIAFRFLRALGFSMTDNPDVKRELPKHEFAISLLYNRLLKLESDGKVVTNPIRSLSEEYVDSKGRTISESGRVKEIMIVEALHSAKYSNNSITNVQGDQEFDLSLNNTLTQVLKELNDLSKSYTEIVKQPHMAYLDINNNPSAKYGVILNSLFDLPVTHRDYNESNKGQRKNVSKEGVENVSLTLVNLNGIKAMIQEVEKSMVSGGGLKTTNLDINSKFLMDLHTMLEAGVMELTRRASKSSAFGLSASQINTKFSNKDKTSYISTGLFADPIRSMNAAVELLKEKVAAEMERIAIVKTGQFDNIPGFKDRGRVFNMFDDILSDDLQKDLIAVANKDDSFTIVNSPEFSERIHKDISNYLNALYDENMALYQEMPFLSQSMYKKVNMLAREDGTRGKSALSMEKAEEVAIRSFTFNSLFHNMEMLALVDGDLAMFNHLKEEYHKRNTYVTSTGRIFSLDASDIAYINNMMHGKNSVTYAKKIGAPETTFSQVMNSVILKDNKVKSAYYDEYLAALTQKYGAEKAKAILKPYNKSKEDGDKGMNEGDAQGWLTFDSYKKLALLEGNWSPKQNELYLKIVNEEEVDPEEIAEFFPPRKYQYGGPLQTDKLHIAAFHKFSLLPLIPSVIKGTNMEIMHNNLVRQGIDYAVFESGSKMATITKNGEADSFYDGDDYSKRTIKNWDGSSETAFTKNPIFINYLKDQVDINSKWKNKTIFSTQLRKLIINDLFKQGFANKPELESLVTKFENELDTLQNYKKQELLEEIGWTRDAEDKPIGDKRKLVDFVRKELSRQGASDHLISFIDLNENGELKNDLSYSLEAEKIEKLLNAVVVKRLVRQKMNGEQLVQASSAGFESQFRKATEDDLSRYGTNDLPSYRPGKGKDGATTAMKVKIAMKGNYYKLLELNSVKDLAKKEGITPLQALNTLLKDDKWLDKDDNRKLITMVGVRIPVQGLNSMEFMEVYEFLPEEAGNIIIPASEIVAKSGGDFDIDKLTIFQPNYSSKYKYAVYSKNENVKGSENRIIENIREILEHPDNFDALIRPNDTDIVKGVADQLEDKNIQGYNRFQNKTNNVRTDKDGKNVISPTRCLEPRYNLYKHESNNIGKKTLGIGAIDNAYSSLFKRIGAYMENKYTFKVWDRNKNKWKTHPRDVNICMDHNTLERNGKTYISLSDINTKTIDKVSDLISQLMNGWVDIEKDTWIFNINGNNVAGPILLFLLETGVDFKTAAYFVSQPLVIDYIKERAKAESPFYEATGKGVKLDKGLAKFNIRKNFIADTFDAYGQLDYLSSKKMYDEYIYPETKGRKFSKEELLKGIESKDKTSDLARQTLMHFFELEDMARDLTNIKLTINVDTSPDKSFFSAQSRLINIEGLNKTDIIKPELVNRFKTNSPIASFFIQKFQLLLFKPLMKLRADEKVNNHLMALVRDGKNNVTFEDPEKFAATFKNDIPLYILQNHLKGLNIDTIKEYSSLKIGKSLPVKGVQLQNGAFVKEGVMYIDKDQISRDFNEKAFAGEGYKKLGLQVLNKNTFSTSTNQNVNLQEYAHFVLEREHLRSITPIKEGQSRQSYEEKLAVDALNRTFNFYTMLKSNTNISDQFQQIKKDMGEEAKDYLIFDQLKPSNVSTDKGIKVLQLKSSKLDTDVANILEENLTNLANPDVIKVADKEKNDKISRFFSRMIVSEYLRNGITKTSDSLAPILPPDMLMRLIKQPMMELAKTGLSDTMLKNYFDLFNSNWATTKKDQRNKFRNYIQPTETLQPTSLAQENERNIVTQDKNGVNLYSTPYEKSNVANLVGSNPQYTFIHLGNENNNGKGISKEYSKGNAIAIPIKSDDASYDKNVQTISDALDLIQEQINNGADIAFPKEGLTTFKETKKVDGEDVESYRDLIQEKAPRTFEFLTTELAKRFGYIHPDAERILGVREAVQEGQPITDKEVEEFMKTCFG